MTDTPQILDYVRQQTEWAATQLRLAEDRTILAAERNYSAWLRAGLASFAVGVGFEAFMGHVHPPWVPKTVASVLILIGIGITWLGLIATRRTYARLHSHVTPRQSIWLLTVINFVLSLAGLATVAILWLA